MLVDSHRGHLRACSGCGSLAWRARSDMDPGRVAELGFELEAGMPVSGRGGAIAPTEAVAPLRGICVCASELPGSPCC